MEEVGGTPARFAPRGKTLALASAVEAKFRFLASGVDSRALYGRKVAGLIWIIFAFFSVACNTYLGLGSTYLGGHDDFVVGPTQDRY